VACTSGAEVYLCRLGCVAAQRARGRAVGGAVEGGVVDVVCVAGGAVVGGGRASTAGRARVAEGAVVGGATAGSGGASTEGGARAAGGAVADGSCMRGGDLGLWIVREVGEEGHSKHALGFVSFYPFDLDPWHHGLLCVVPSRRAWHLRGRRQDVAVVFWHWRGAGRKQLQASCGQGTPRTLTFMSW
jgi:hypothetical protein